MHAGDKSVGIGQLRNGDSKNDKTVKGLAYTYGESFKDFI